MASDDDIARENYEFYRYCRVAGHDDFLRRAETSTDFYAGKQWTNAELAEMRATNRPALTINQTFRTLDSIVGEMLYSTGDVRFTPASLEANPDAADALDKIWVNTNQVSGTQYFEPQILLMGLLTGRGYYDVRMDFDRQLMGQIKISMKRPQNIVLNPQITSRDPDDWPEVFETRYSSIDDISMMYGAEVAKEIEAAGQSSFLSPEDRMEERLLSSRINRLPVGLIDFSQLSSDNTVLKTRRLIERQYRTIKYKNFFVDPQTGDSSEVPENWDRNRIARMVELAGVQVVKLRASTIRWRVTCDRFVLHDEDSPYNHFTIVPFFPWFTDGYTLSLGENLVDMQRMTNKLYSQYLHILNSAANGGWKVKNGSLKNMTTEELEANGAKTGLVAVLENVDDLERIQPGALPNGHDSLAAAVRSMFDDVSGYTNTMKGADRADAAGKAIDAKIARGAVNLATAYNAIYHAKTMLAKRVADLAQTYYTETRYVRIDQGFQGGAQGIQINAPQPDGSFLNDITVGKYSVMVVPSPQRETVEQNTFQQLLEMRQELGVMIPDDVLIQYSAIPDKKRVADAIKAAGGTPEQQQAQAEMAQQLQQAQLMLTQAQAQNAAAQAELAKSRAAKAVSEASQPPQSEVRAQLDQQRMAMEAERDQRAHDLEQRGQDLDAAQKLTALQLQHHQEMTKIQTNKEVAIQKNKNSSTPKPKKQPQKRK